MKKESKTVYLDASFLISGLVSKHQFYSLYIKKVEKLLEQDCVLCISQLTVDEVIHTLNILYKVSKMEVKSKFVQILKNTNVNLVTENIITKKQTTGYLNFWAASKLKPRDAMHIFLMKQNKIKTIATFDKDFIKYQEKLKIKIA